MKKALICLLLSGLLLLCACGETSFVDGENKETSAQSTAQTEENRQTSPDLQEAFSDRDLDGSYDEEEGVLIDLQGTQAHCDGAGVQISGAQIRITEAGCYVLSGSLLDGSLTVDCDKEDKVQLVLNNAEIHSSSSAAIYVLQGDKVFLTTEEGSVNTLSNGGSFVAVDENNIDAVIFSKEDLSLNGSGSLKISSPAGHGIVSKDELTVTGGSYEIICAGHGLSGKDNICIADGTFSIEAGKDGIHSEHDEDAALGYVYMEGGSFTIEAAGDGISAGSTLTVCGGEYSLLCGGGYTNAEEKSSDGWGGFGGRGGPGDFGGHGGPDGNSEETSAQEDSSTSMKGLKAGTLLQISEGTFSVNAADDALHSNGSVEISGGTYEIQTGDDAVHGEERLLLSGGSLRISESYEGLEALHIEISGGTLYAVSADDGLNAAGGTDQSGFGGRDNGMFGMPGGMGSGAEGSILISGGSIYLMACGDGIDANGSLTITGGRTVVCCPGRGDTSALDYDSTAEISGGSFLGTGAAGMAQSFSGGSQAVLALSVGDQKAGTEIRLTDGDEKELFCCSPELDFAVVIFSSPEMEKGAAYKITVGEQWGEFTAG